MAIHTLTLTQTETDDLPAFFGFQLDKEANYLAAFTSKDPSNKRAYLEKYTNFLTDPTIHMRTIKADDEMIGSIVKFVIENDAEITYWIDRKFWNKGTAIRALQRF